ncbi:hypothetical protein ACF3NG_02280 [Aerococcaceae bacterium WGS1372]
MSHEIIEKIKESEDAIIKLNHEMEKKKEQFQARQAESLRDYQAELQQSLDAFTEDTHQLQEDELISLNDTLQQEVEKVRAQSEQFYQSHKEVLIQSGVKEVLKDYGDFSYETRPHRR